MASVGVAAFGASIVLVGFGTHDTDRRDAVRSPGTTTRSAEVSSGGSPRTDPSDRSAPDGAVASRGEASTGVETDEGPAPTGAGPSTSDSAEADPSDSASDPTVDASPAPMDGVPADGPPAEDPADRTVTTTQASSGSSPSTTPATEPPAETDELEVTAAELAAEVEAFVGLGDPIDGIVP